ncbi:MAG: hypothetical protein UW55_C0035G0001, partial [Candidatus Giovannonibacteria bacterium GW2011_GWA2_44_26]
GVLLHRLPRRGDAGLQSGRETQVFHFFEKRFGFYSEEKRVKTDINCERAGRVNPGEGEHGRRDDD